MKGFVPLLLVLFVLAVIVKVEFFFTIFYLFAGLYLLSQFWMGRIRAGFDAARSYPSHVFVTQRVNLSLRLSNKSWLPIPWIELVESLPADLTTPWQPDLVHLGPHDAQVLSYDFIPRKRGYYAIGPLKIATGDVFGIVPRFRTEIPRSFLTVYPRIAPLQELGLPTRSPLAVLPSTWPLFEDTSRVTGVRAYEPGDSPRHIHWTASASAGQLLVKRYQPAVARDTLIFLDLNREHYMERLGGIELAIVTAASIAYHVAVREGLPVGLATEAQEMLTYADETYFLPPRSERAHLMHILEILARVNPVSDSAFIAQLKRERARLSYGTTLVVITGHENAELFDALALLQHAGFAVALILVQPTRERGESISVPRGLSLYRVWIAEDLETKL